MIEKLIILYLLTLCSCEDRNDFDNPEGSACIVNGDEGMCTNVNKCKPVFKYPQQKIRVPICSFQGNTPIVCCKFCKRNQMEKDPLDFERLSSRYQPSKAKDNCLKYLRTLDYHCKRKRDEGTCLSVDNPGFVKPENSNSGNLNLKVKRNAENLPTMNTSYASASRGITVHAGNYPHLALLGYGNDPNSAQWLCAGSVISEKYILTAGHCISSPTLGPVKFVALNVLTRSDILKNWQKHNVKRIIAHPEYQSPSKYNDIALLETETLISFKAYVLPACLPLDPEPNESAEAAGWGALGYRKALSDTLQSVTLKKFAKEQCSDLYPIHRNLREGFNETTQMCYGDMVGLMDTCEGDSGGPLQISNEFLSCANTVMGVTSFGARCGLSVGSGIYTRVYHYVPWIESIVWP